MGQPFFTQPTAAIQAPAQPGGATARVSTGGDAAERRAAGGAGGAQASHGEGWQRSDELDEEDEVGEARPTDASSQAEDAEEAREKAEAERKALEDEKKELEARERDLEAQADELQREIQMARRMGEKDDEAALRQQLAEVRGQQDEVAARMQEIDEALGALPAGGAPAAPGGTVSPGAGVPAAPGGAVPPGAGVPAAPGGGYPAGGGLPTGGGFPGGGVSPAGPVGGGGVPSVAQSGAASQPVPGGPIGKGTKVLMIGDSHTIGAFGTELDQKLRSTGAQVETYGSSGSSPSWWMDGHTTTSGFVARHADGSVEQPPWNQPHATPRLEALIAKEKPDVLVVNLGANMRGASPEQIRKEVARIGEVAKASGTRLVWVGPPRQRSDMGSSASIDAFNAQMAKAVAPYGSYIDSSRYTQYAGSDGIHYGGTEGTRTARSWADHIFDDLQG